jgi:hypothetical protein
MRIAQQTLIDRIRDLEADRQEVLDQIDHRTKLRRRLIFLQDQIERANDELRRRLLNPVAERLQLLHEDRDYRPFKEHPVFAHYFVLAAKELLIPEVFERIHAEGRELLESAIELGLQTTGITRRQLPPKPRPIPTRQPQLVTDVKPKRKQKVPANGNQPAQTAASEEQLAPGISSETHNKTQEISKEVGKA